MHSETPGDGNMLCPQTQPADDSHWLVELSPDLMQLLLSHVTGTGDGTSVQKREHSEKTFKDIRCTMAGDVAIMTMLCHRLEVPGFGNNDLHGKLLELDVSKNYGFRDWDPAKNEEHKVGSCWENPNGSVGRQTQKMKWRMIVVVHGPDTYLCAHFRPEKEEEEETRAPKRKRGDGGGGGGSGGGGKETVVVAGKTVSTEFQGVAVLLDNDADAALTVRKNLPFLLSVARVYAGDLTTLPQETRQKLADEHERLARLRERLRDAVVQHQEKKPQLDPRHVVERRNDDAVSAVVSFSMVCKRAYRTLSLAEYMKTPKKATSMTSGLWLRLMPALQQNKQLRNLKGCEKWGPADLATYNTQWRVQWPACIDGYSHRQIGLGFSEREQENNTWVYNVGRAKTPNAPSHCCRSYLYLSMVLSYPPWVVVAGGLQEHRKQLAALAAHIAERALQEEARKVFDLSTPKSMDATRAMYFEWYDKAMQNQMAVDHRFELVQILPYQGTRVVTKTTLQRTVEDMHYQHTIFQQTKSSSHPHPHQHIEPISAFQQYLYPDVAQGVPPPLLLQHQPLPPHQAPQVLLLPPHYQ
ncbi:MAG: hypothetical protein CMI16_03105 [Opitutaceae bacterium]|nr:hypothetical protein [Opitutaceae bacterium]